MSINAIEKAIWQATTNAEAMSAYCADMGKYLEQFLITDNERDLLMTWKLNELVERGVNPGLLLAAFSAIHGRGRRAEYLHAMRENV